MKFCLPVVLLLAACEDLASSNVRAEDRFCIEVGPREEVTAFIVKCVGDPPNDEEDSRTENCHDMVYDLFCTRRVRVWTDSSVGPYLTLTGPKYDGVCDGKEPKRARKACRQ